MINNVVGYLRLGLPEVFLPPNILIKLFPCGRGGFFLWMLEDLKPPPTVLETFPPTIPYRRPFGFVPIETTWCEPLALVWARGTSVWTFPCAVGVDLCPLDLKILIFSKRSGENCVKRWKLFCRIFLFSFMVESFKIRLYCSIPFFNVIIDLLYS